jgi:hypothetical protein
MPLEDHVAPEGVPRLGKSAAVRGPAPVQRCVRLMRSTIDTTPQRPRTCRVAQLLVGRR